MQFLHEVMEPGHRAFWAIVKTESAAIPKLRANQIGWTARQFDAKKYPRHVLRAVRENGHVALEYLRGLH